ncbi:hypothetical protein FQN50_000035 [Emmonsiellopsis sp. PD_5]|nr:hypothetical protein FQN50_000035 [Emmonsiellopsis sp. PD_5]
MHITIQYTGKLPSEALDDKLQSRIELLFSAFAAYSLTVGSFILIAGAPLGLVRPVAVYSRHLFTYMRVGVSDLLLYGAIISSVQGVSNEDT